jgi:catalase
VSAAAQTLGATRAASR